MVQAIPNNQNMLGQLRTQSDHLLCSTALKPFRIVKDATVPYDATRELLNLGLEDAGSQLRDFYNALYKENKAPLLSHIYCRGMPQVSMDLIKALTQYSVDVNFKGTQLEGM